MAYGLARIALEGMAEEAALYLAHPESQLPQRRRRLSQARQAARGWSETLPAERRRSLAALFVQACLTAYAAKAAPGLNLSAPFEPPKGRFSLATQALADEVARQAADLPLDEALHGLTGLYSALLDSRERGERGAFYTPPVLAQRLLDLAGEQGLDWKTARVLDPASGGGAFLVPAALRMRAALAGADPAFVLAQIGARLQGLEMDVHAAWIGQAALEIALADLAIEARRPVPVVVTVGDSLEASPTESFDLVVGNPPYGRVALTDDQRARYGRSLYGHANLYGVFTDLALRWTRPGGLVAYLTPTSFLGGRYYGALRRLLAEEAPPAAIDFVHDRSGVFEDVLQETCLTVYRKGAAPARAQVHYVTLDEKGAARIERNGAIAL
ncbi:MAG: SAM-dependent methyltransferase, partial [Caulobacteraceae bacterium]|nr:SAM-dependent methyltransferase [Caulobacteraceae bacterium]